MTASEQKFCADMNRIAQTYADMARRRRAEMRLLLLIPGVPALLMAYVAVYVHNWGPVATALVLALLVVRGWRQAQAEWDHCMLRRQETLEERDTALRIARGENDR